jgi:glycosyltransferase involved in cell wall biosynthesis
MFLYAGDLETSSGARTFAAAVPAIVRHVPDAMCVIACRAKTGRAETARRALEAELRPVAPHVRFAGEVPDLPALVASAAAFAFPVDELHGKVDLPYALLEACLLRVPVVAARGTPLEELEGALLVAPGDPAALADRCVGLARDAAAARQIGEALRRQVMDRHAADKVAERYEQLYDRIGP